MTPGQQGGEDPGAPQQYPASGEAPVGDAGAPAAPNPSAGPALLARVEVLDRDGHARQSRPVHQWPLTLGRAIDNYLVIDDPHVAAHHAVIELGPQGVAQLRVLPGKNGLRCGKRLLPAGGEAVTLDALAEVADSRATRPIELTLGVTRLRLRRASDALEPERALPVVGAGRTGTLMLALLLWMWVLAEFAIGQDPGSKVSDWLPPLLGAPLALGGWCLMWGLASKIFQQRFEFWPHVAVAVRGALAVEVASFALSWLTGISGWSGFARVITGCTTAIALVTLWAHARLVLPHQRRALAYVATAAYITGTAILLALNQQRHERWFAALYSHVLPPPSLAWKKPTPSETFVKRAERLRPALEKSTAEAVAERKERGEDEEE